MDKLQLFEPKACLDDTYPKLVIGSLEPYFPLICFDSSLLPALAAWHPGSGSEVSASI